MLGEMEGDGQRTWTDHSRWALSWGKVENSPHSPAFVSPLVCRWGLQSQQGPLG